MARSLTKTYAKKFPKSPMNAAGIIESYNDEFVRENYGLTLRNNSEERSMFLKHAYTGNGFEYCLFASDDVIKAIEKNIAPENRFYYMDGTFAIVPVRSNSC